MSKTATKQRTMSGPFELHVINEPDYDHPEPKVNPDDYTGCTADEIATYVEQDQQRLDAYRRGDWYFLRLGVELRVRNRNNWAVWATVGRAYLAGVESDSEQIYIDNELDSLRREAEADAHATYRALKAIFEPTEVK